MMIITAFPCCYHRIALLCLEPQRIAHFSHHAIVVLLQSLHLSSVSCVDSIGILARSDSIFVSGAYGGDVQVARLLGQATQAQGFFLVRVEPLLSLCSFNPNARRMVMSLSSELGTALEISQPCQH